MTSAARSKHRMCASVALLHPGQGHQLLLAQILDAANGLRSPFGVRVTFRRRVCGNKSGHGVVGGLVCGSVDAGIDCVLTWQNRITRILVRDLMPHAEFSALVRESDKALCVVLLGVEFGNRGFLPFLRTGAHRHFEERRGVAPILPFLVLKKCGDRMGRQQVRASVPPEVRCSHHPEGAPYLNLGCYGIEPETASEPPQPTGSGRPASPDSGFHTPAARHSGERSAMQGEATGAAMRLLATLQPAAQHHVGSVQVVRHDCDKACRVCAASLSAEGLCRNPSRKTTGGPKENCGVQRSGKLVAGDEP
jgi:hypothetical protein